MNVRICFLILSFVFFIGQVLYGIIQFKTKTLNFFKALLVDVDENVAKNEDATEDATSTDTTEELMEQDPLAVVAAPVKIEEPMTIKEEEDCDFVSAVKIEVDVDFEVDE